MAHLIDAVVSVASNELNGPEGAAYLRLLISLGPRAVKRAASEAIVANGATITHHHATGRDHVPYMEAEVGETGLEVLRAVKERLDPTGIMNPGKLLP